MMDDDALAESAQFRALREARAQSDWRKTETEDERRFREAYEKTIEGDKRTSLLRDIGLGITHMGESPSALAEGLAAAADSQMALNREQLLPLSMAAERSRQGTFPEQMSIFENIALAARRRGDVYQQVAPQLQALALEFQEKGELSPDELVQLHQILRILAESGAMGQQTADRIFADVGMNTIIGMPGYGASSRQGTVDDLTPAGGSL